MQPFQLFLWLSPMYLSLIVAEIAWFRWRKKSYPWRDVGASVAVFLGSKLTELLTASVALSIGGWIYSHRLHTFAMDKWSDWVLLFLGVEFAYYWFHRWSHEIRWMWASHAVHHSPQQMNFPSAYRLGWTGIITGGILFWQPVVWIGFPPSLVALTYGLNLAYQFWLHTEMFPRLGWFEYLFNTPAHHRVHHASNAAYLDTNYGGVLIIFDRLFGTFAAEKADLPVRYGLTTPLTTRNPLRIAFHEWQALARDVWRAHSWRERFGYAFGPPGWSLDGTRSTAAMLKREAAAQEANGLGLVSGRGDSGGALAPCPTKVRTPDRQHAAYWRHQG